MQITLTLDDDVHIAVRAAAKPKGRLWAGSFPKCSEFPSSAKEYYQKRNGLLVLRSAWKPTSKLAFVNALATEFRDTLNENIVPRSSYECLRTSGKGRFSKGQVSEFVVLAVRPDEHLLVAVTVRRELFEHRRQVVQRDDARDQR